MLAKKIPVTIISGFLGAGKTTLVNHLLAQSDAASTGVIVNEFGQQGVDGELIYAEEKAVIEIRNGCVCCTVRADLVEGVRQMLRQDDYAINRLIVETSGLADPGPVLQTFLADADLLQQVYLESVITVVDAVNVHRLEHDDIAAEQIAFSDLIVLNKAELADQTRLENVKARLRTLNPTARILPASHAQLPLDALIGQQRFSLSDILEIEPGLLTEEHDHEHDSSIQSCSVHCDGDIDPTLFNRWINRLVAEQGEQLMRTKGILSFPGEARQFYFHSVHMLVEARPGKLWPRDNKRSNVLVAIGRHLDEVALRTGFFACRVQQTEPIPV